MKHAQFILYVPDTLSGLKYVMCKVRTGMLNPAQVHLPLSALTVPLLWRLAGREMLLAASNRWRLVVVCRCFLVAHRSAFFGVGNVVIAAGILLYPAPQLTRQFVMKMSN